MKWKYKAHSARNDAIFWKGGRLDIRPQTRAVLTCPTCGKTRHRLSACSESPVLPSSGP